MPNKISQQSVREAALPLTVWGMVHCSGRLGSKYSPGPGCSRAKGGEGRQGGRSYPGRLGWGLRGPGRDMGCHPVQIPNCKYRRRSHREREEQGQDLSPWPKHRAEEQWAKDTGCSLSHYGCGLVPRRWRAASSSPPPVY